MTNLVEVGDLGDLRPQVLHDLLVVLESLLGELTAALQDGGPHSQALEVILVQVAIVVNVCGNNKSFSRVKYLLLHQIELQNPLHFSRELKIVVFDLFCMM